MSESLILTDVGIRTALRARREQQALTAALATVTDPSTYPIASPWSASDLQRIVFEDVFGDTVPCNTRSAAMKIPAIARGRNLLVATIADLPLAAAAVADRVVPSPAWMTNSIDGTSPQHRMVWTVDDLIFYGRSLWWRENYADTGFPRAVGRINQGEWTITADNRVEVQGRIVEPNEVILITGYHEGILTFGADVLRDARDLYAIVRQRLRTPIPSMDLHQTGGEPLNEEEIDALTARWDAARNKLTGGVGYTSENIEARPLGADGDAQLMIEARNAASLDLARVIGVTAGMLDATAPKASLNYETTTGRNQEFSDRDLKLYTGPIAGRLSMDDVMPKGQRAYFDLGDFTAPAPSPTGPALED